MDDKAHKEGIPESLGGGEEAGTDPYLDQLDSSLEDLGEEEPTRYDVPSGEAPAGEAPPKPIPEAPVAKAPAAKPPAAPALSETLDFASDIPVTVRVVIGDKQTTLGELLELKKGELLEMDKGLETAVDLMVQDKVVARGELVEIDGRMGVRIIRVLEGS